MKAVILNGAEKDDQEISLIENALSLQLSQKGWEVEVVELCKKQIAGCLGCFGCWIKTPGICVIDDYGREVPRMFCQSDLIVMLTPVTFGGYSFELKKALDRNIPVLLPYFELYKGQIHHKMRYKKYPSLLFIGTEPLNDKYGETFIALTERNALNLRPPRHASGLFEANHTKDASAFVEGLLKQVGA